MRPDDIASAVQDNAGDLATYWPHIVAGLEHFGINDHLTRVGVAATVATECDFRWLTELASGWDYEGRADLGNTQSGDGPRYKGRGFVQLTGRDEYQRAGDLLGLDLIGNPDLAADPHVAGLTLGWYFASHGLRGVCDNQDWYAVRRIVNGGYNGISRFLGCISNLLAIPDEPTPPAAPPVTTVSISGALKIAPNHLCPRALDESHHFTGDLPVGMVVAFTRDPHTGLETTPSWAHVQLDKRLVHGWYLRASLVTTGG